MSNNLAHLIGIPFVDGGRDPKKGLDCWGLLMQASREFGYKVPDYNICAFCSPDIWEKYKVETGRLWRKVKSPTPGCVLAFATDPEMPDAVCHFGIYIGRGQFLHTLKKSSSILSRLDHFYWRNKLRGIYEWAGE